MTDRVQDTRVERALVIVGMVILAVNLRPAVSSLGTLLDEVRGALGISPALAGLLTTLPVLCFAFFGPIASTVARRIGLHRTALLTLTLVCSGLVLRAFTGSPWFFFAASTLALAGAASGNVLLPPLVKRHFPDRVGLFTAIYSTALVAGVSLGSLISVPVANATGNWRDGLLTWGVLAGVAMVPWLGLLRHDVRAEEERNRAYAVSDILRSRLAWSMALFFGIQSSMAYAMFGWLPKVYTDAGLSPAMAGALVSLLAGVGIPMALVIPYLAARRPDQSAAVIVLGTLTAGGFVGLLVAPLTLPWLWALMLGTGFAAFPWGLTMIGMRSRTHDGTVVLSGFVQSVGYLIAAIGPFATGLLYDLTGGWTVPLTVLALACVPKVIFGLLFARPSYVEDDLGRRAAVRS
ncbi:MAG: MFS transporter [Propionibacteriales bacterium]|nr:MFS transporter [Propionibacteriales bacterium]